MTSKPDSSYKVGLLKCAPEPKDATYAKRGKDREQIEPVATVHKSPEASLSSTRKFVLYAVLTLLATVLVSSTPEMHHHTDTSFMATGNSTAGMQRDSKQERLAPLLGANEGLLRPAGAASANLPMPNFFRGWLSPNFPRQHAKHGFQSHNWRTSLALNHQPAIVQYHTAKAPSNLSSSMQWFRLTQLTERNQQLQSELAEIKQTATLYDEAQLRMAELESELAHVSAQHKQSTAYLMAAVRQLSITGQTFHAPTSSSGCTAPVGQRAVPGAVALLGLAVALWVMLQQRQKMSSDKQHASVLQEAHDEVQEMKKGKAEMVSQLQQQQQALQQAEQRTELLSSEKSAAEAHLRSSQQQVKRLQADLAKAELQLENAAAAKTKLPFFPMSPLATPPVRHDGPPTARMDHDKENKTSPTNRHTKSHAQAQAAAEVKQAQQDSAGSFLAARLQHMQAENEALTGQLATLQEEQQKLKDACLKADTARTQSQLNSEALELRVFTTLEQLALSEEKEADLAAALAATTAAERAATASQAAQMEQRMQLDAEQAEKRDLISRLAELEAQLAAKAKADNPMPDSTHPVTVDHNSAANGSSGTEEPQTHSDSPSSVSNSTKKDASAESAPEPSSALTELSASQHSQHDAQALNPSSTTGINSSSPDADSAGQVGLQHDAGHLTASAATAGRQSTAGHVAGQPAIAQLAGSQAAMLDPAEAPSKTAQPGASMSSAGVKGQGAASQLAAASSGQEVNADQHAAAHTEVGLVHQTATETRPVPLSSSAEQAVPVEDSSVYSAAAPEDQSPHQAAAGNRFADTSTVNKAAADEAAEDKHAPATAKALGYADGHAMPSPVAPRQRTALSGEEEAPSSPIFGVATSSALNSPDSAMSRSSSRDWLGGIFSGRNTGRNTGKNSSRNSVKNGSKGAVSPTRLFEGLTRATSDPEDLFGGWHGPKRQTNVT